MPKTYEKKANETQTHRRGIDVGMVERSGRWMDGWMNMRIG